MADFVSFDVGFICFLRGQRNASDIYVLLFTFRILSDLQFHVDRESATVTRVIRWSDLSSTRAF